MVVHDFDFLGSGLGPSKAHAELVVDSDAVLAFSVAFQRFKSVSWGYPEVLEAPGDLELPELSAGY